MNPNRCDWLNRDGVQCQNPPLEGKLGCAEHERRMWRPAPGAFKAWLRDRLDEAEARHRRADPPAIAAE